MRETFPLACERLGLLIGEPALARLCAAHVLVVGLGGVGGACVESLTRCGIGRLTLIDGDAFVESNLNRQLIATRETLGMPKVEAARLRVTSVAPDASVSIMHRRLVAEEIPELLAGLEQDAKIDACVDAIDDIPVKAALAVACARGGIHETACLGMGKRLDPTQVRIGDLFSVTHDPLARALRRLLRRDGIGALRVVYSLEPPSEREAKLEDGVKVIPSGVFVPNAAGLALAYDVVTALIKGEDGQ